MASWPSTLPLPQVPGYALKPAQAFLRTPMDSGPARQRRRFSTTPSSVPVSLMFSEAQLATFEAWHHYEISDGAGWFTITLANGKGLTACEARFSGPYEAVPNGSTLQWVMTANLEVRSMPILTEAELVTRL